jgi:hypothetical protein
MRYIVDYFDDDQKRRTTVVDATIPEPCAHDLERMKPFIAKQLIRPKSIRSIKPQEYCDVCGKPKDSPNYAYHICARKENTHD